jgi:hypothetical protein
LDFVDKALTGKSYFYTLYGTFSLAFKQRMGESVTPEEKQNREK